MESNLKKPVNRHHVRRCRPLLGTFVEISVVSDSDPVAMHEWISEAFTLVESVHSIMSFQEPQSALSRLNEIACPGPVIVHDWLRQVLWCGCEIGARSGGAFDIAYGSRDGGSYCDIVFYPGNAVSFHRPLSVDLGGIAKGFAVDLALESLAGRGVFSACVNAGGDMRFTGEKPASVELRDPLQPFGKTRRAALIRDAVASSAPYFRRGGDEIIRPGGHGPMRNHASVTVFADSCMIADALTKIAVLCDDEKANAIMAAYGADMLLLNPVTA